MQFPLLARVWRSVTAENLPRLAAALAFSAIFSLAPLLIILIALAGYVLAVQHVGHAHALAENVLLEPIRASAGSATADAVRALVTTSFEKPRQGLIAQIVGWSAFIVGAAGFFSALQDALNTIWHAKATGGWRGAVRGRIASLAVVLFAAVLLVMTFALNAAIALLNVPRAAGTIASIVPAIVVFTFIYKVLPDKEIAWRDAWVGGSITAVLYAVGETLIALYLGTAGVASGYGAAGSLLVGLLWIYYSAIVVLLGAVITKELAERGESPAP